MVHKNDILKLDNQLCFAVYAFSREITNQYKPMLHELGLTYPQYLVLLVLWQHKEQTVNQLGEQLRLDSGTLTPLLKRMEQKGVLTRTRSESDERVVMVSLTTKGKAMKTKAQCIPEKLAQSLNMSVKEVMQLQKTIRKILTNI